MSKMKKMAESFVDNLIRRNILKNLDKVSASELGKMIAEEMADELKWGEVSESYLHDYSTKRLVDTLTKLSEKGLDEDSVEMVFNIINILNMRFRQYSLETGDDDIRVSPEKVDKILFPKQKIPPVKRSDGFTIDSWSELNIEIRNINPKTIIFYKMILGKPSKEKPVHKTLKELHWGDATIEIFKLLNMVNAVPYRNKNAVGRVNKALKELFNMGKKVAVTTKDGVISTEVNITHYDNNDILVTNYNIHHDAPEDKTEEIPSFDDYDEENIGCQADERPDDDTNELDFNY